MPIRVLLADDKEFVRRSIRRLLEDQPEIELVGEASDFAQTILIANELKPQIIVLDIHMPDETKITAAEVKSHLKSDASRILAVSIWQDEDAHALAKYLGAGAFLDKAGLADNLMPTIMQLVS
jgi:DNA-binding NarL/FixJ family response regulator